MLPHNSLTGITVIDKGMFDLKTLDNILKESTFQI